MNQTSAFNKKENLAWTLALEALEGVGRVSVRRIVAKFPTWESFKIRPFEQIKVQLKGVSKTDALIKKVLFDADFEKQLYEQIAYLDELEGMRVETYGFLDSAWWPALNLVEPPPNYVHLFGDKRILDCHKIAFFGAPPLDPASFEAAQGLIRYLLAQELAVTAGAAHGFDLVVHKLASEVGKPSLIIPNSGLKHITPSFRPQVMQTVRAGGLVLTPFGFQVPTSPYQDFERASLMASLASACVVISPAPKSPEERAMHWALAHEKPVFGFGTNLAEGVQPLEREADFAWVKMVCEQV